MDGWLDKYRIKLAPTPKLMLVSMFCFVSTASLAVVSANIEKRINFQFDLNHLRTNISLSLSSKDVFVAIPHNKINERMAISPKDIRVEPIQLTISEKEDDLLDLVHKIAKPQSRLQLANYIKTNFSHGEDIPGTDLKLITIDRKAYGMIDQKAFDELFRKTHHKVSIDTTSLRKSSQEREKLLAQLKPFLPTNDLAAIQKKIAAGKPLLVDKDILPPFAREKIGTHSIFRGPNCFHAALAFQSPLLAASKNINVREEYGYHEDMINYDELWRALKLAFYEIDPEKTNIQYGDMIVFFETKDIKPSTVEYRALRHAATYLMGGYVFEKGSKSANSPYLVRTLDEEWDTWTKYTDKLGIKIYRRSLNYVNNPTIVDLQDWAY